MNYLIRHINGEYIVCKENPYVDIPDSQTMEYEGTCFFRYGKKYRSAISFQNALNSLGGEISWERTNGVSSRDAYEAGLEKEYEARERRRQVFDLERIARAVHKEDVKDRLVLAAVDNMLDSCGCEELREIRSTLAARLVE